MITDNDKRAVGFEIFAVPEVARNSRPIRKVIKCVKNEFANVAEEVDWHTSKAAHDCVNQYCKVEGCHLNKVPASFIQRKNIYNEDESRNYN